jgi:hypothetical protein
MKIKHLILILAMTASVAHSEETLRPRQAGENSAYYELVGPKISAATITKEQAESPVVTLGEWKSVQTHGFRTVRIFVQVLDLGATKSLPKEATATIRVAHNTQSGSTPYATKEFPIGFGVGDSAFIEAPVLGPTLRILVDGQNLPSTDAQIITTVYLVR